MKSKKLYSTLMALFFLLGGAFSQGSSTRTSSISGTSDEWFTKAKEYVTQMEYSFQPIQEAYSFRVANRKNQLGFTLNPHRYTVHKMQFKPGEATWEVNFNLTGIARDAQGIPFGSQSAVIDNQSLRYKGTIADIEYVNGQDGLRQNFIVHKKMAGQSALRINMTLQTSLSASLINEKKLVFHTNGNTRDVKMIYDELKVWDANHQALSAHMELKNNNLALVVDDANATYPVTIDPLNHTPEWITSADGVLPALLTNLQLQVDAIYGYSVVGLGDVNNDGYDDAAVGAPGAIDVIAGPVTVAGAGAVFVYFGSATGLPTTPSKILRSTTPIANALFGFSIAGGNVIGNTRNDIIVGAPGESYSATVGGFPGTANVTAGKVYVFRGEDLSAAGNPSPFLSVYLNGSTYFSNGILGVIASNTAINALFGFSVAATEDMNGDGLGEVIVGSPGYAEASVLPLLPVRTGTALVYYSTNLASNTPTRLTAPSATLLGIPIIPDGLLFGFSVDGLGDYNMDGQPDVVVGAPAGATLVPPTNILGGSAYIFTGNGAGVNTSHYAHLRANTSLIGTIANLFGYSVRGVRNADGSRNGNVLVGAPSGTVLSNILGGLRLKTGTVNVFVKTSATPAASGETPDQAIASPRGNSLLSILSGRDLEVSALFGASIDNMLDVNCDGINDIIVGEPLSTGVGLISANAVGGAADIFIGRADGTYVTSVFWNLYNNTDFPFGINAGSLLGFSVAGARHVKGNGNGVRALIGAPGAMLDFSTGIFNLPLTFGTIFDFVAGDNGIGKAYVYGFDDCGLLFNPDVNVTWVNVPVPGNVNTNDDVPDGTSYGTPVPRGSNPPGGSISMNADGSYSFVSSKPGVYYYDVPVCIPGQNSPCPTTELKITVLEATSNQNPPVANTDLGTTKAGTPIVIKTLSNDKCSNIGCSLNAGTVTVTDPPSNGTYSIDPGTGNITYTPNPGFTGRDTLTYQVCDNGAPSQCATADQIITVYGGASLNTTEAADDYAYTQQGTPATGNVKTNDTDPEGNTQTVAPQSGTIPGKGTYVINADGSFTFTPLGNFSGPVAIPYTTCDNGTPSACAKATLYILVKQLGVVPVVLIDFYARQQSQTVVVRWTTEQEVNISHYEVLRSNNGSDYSVIAVVLATGSAGRTNYQFIDAAPLKGNNFYRIRMIDNDASFRYTSIALVKLIDKNSSDLSVAPNPIQHDFKIRMAGFEKGSYRVELVNAMGQIQMTKRISITDYDHIEPMNRESKWSAGIYWLSVTDEKTNNRVKQIAVYVSPY